MSTECGEPIGLGRTICHGSDYLPAKAPEPLVLAHQAGAALRDTAQTLGKQGSQTTDNRPDALGTMRPR
ncbi:hypothetical protein GCM10023085_55550 [Actinomadura viridis]